MRKEEFIKGDYVHVYNRGNRKEKVARDDKDKWRFLQALRYFNTENSIHTPIRRVKELLKSDANISLRWPESWPIQDPLVKILAFVVVSNHYHLLLKEIKKGGIAAFMQKFGTGITNYFNTRHEEVGRLFQGPYKAKRIDSDQYLRYVSVYIQVKHPFELYPGGFQQAVAEFDKAWEWASEYLYSSLGDYAGKRNLPIIDKELLGELFPTPASYKKFSRECLEFMDLKKQLGDLAIE